MMPLDGAAAFFFFLSTQMPFRQPLMPMAAPRHMSLAAYAVFAARHFVAVIFRLLPKIFATPQPLMSHADSRVVTTRCIDEAEASAFAAPILPAATPPPSR